jgi:AcrR family transcriptional regulator
VGRSRSFDEESVLRLATARFLVSGYQATSVDDLLESTGLHRGSLYQAFGSKRGVFVAALELLLSRELQQLVEAEHLTLDDLTAQPVVDLVLVAALELAPNDDAVREQVARAGLLIDRALTATQTGADLSPAVVALGARLWRRAHLSPSKQERN